MDRPSTTHLPFIRTTSCYCCLFANQDSDDICEGGREPVPQGEACVRACVELLSSLLLWGRLCFSHFVDKTLKHRKIRYLAWGHTAGAGLSWGLLPIWVGERCSYRPASPAWGHLSLAPRFPLCPPPLQCPLSHFAASLSQRLAWESVSGPGVGGWAMGSRAKWAALLRYLEG